MTDLKTTIRRLSKAQRAAFDFLCYQSNSNGCGAINNQLVVKVLERRGLILILPSGECVATQEAFRAWRKLQFDDAKIENTTHCPECRAELFLIENRRICPNGHGKSVPVGVRGRDLEKAERKRVEIVPRDLSKVTLAGFRQ